MSSEEDSPVEILVALAKRKAEQSHEDLLQLLDAFGVTNVQRLSESFYSLELPSAKAAEFAKVIDFEVKRLKSVKE